MRLRVNGNDVEMEGETATVRELLARMRYTFPLIVVKVNEVMIPREAYDRTSVKADDIVDAYHLVSGG